MSARRPPLRAPEARSAARSPARSVARRAAVAALLAATAVGGATGGRARAEDRQPSPPRIFFASPDEATWGEIAPLIENSFGDVNKAPVARDVLVRRFGLWSVPPLLDRLDKDTNESVSWNAILALGSLRRALGPSQHLWPAIRVLTKVLRTGADPYRRAFAALALGEFYGPDLARVGPWSREGTAEGFTEARKALAEAQTALAAALVDDSAPVQTAAALALGKIGGAEAAGLLLRAKPELSHWQPRAARLVAAGLLPGSDGGALAAALKDGSSKIRAAAALAVAAWATGQVYGEGTEVAGVAITRANEFEALLDPVRNTAIRAGEDGAEAIFARGALAHVTRKPAPWEELYRVAVAPSTEAVTAIAATQALLFSPPQSAVRRQLAEFIGRDGSGLQREPTVVAGFLLVAGTDALPVGIRACREFLGNRARDPRGRVDWDPRFHAIVGLARALEAGVVEGSDRLDALKALAEASKSLLPGDPGAHSFKSVFEDVLGRTARDAFEKDPTLKLSDKARARLEAAFVDPDAMTARDPIDLVVDRLNDFAWILFGLDGVKPAAGGGIGTGGPRQPRTDDEPQRFLMAWLRAEPYFTRIDLHRERGVVPAPPAPPRDPARELDK